MGQLVVDGAVAFRGHLEPVSVRHVHRVEQPRVAGLLAAVHDARSFGIPATISSARWIRPHCGRFGGTRLAQTRDGQLALLHVPDVVVTQDEAAAGRVPFYGVSFVCYDAGS